MKKLLLLTALSVAASTAMATQISVGDPKEFRPLDKSLQTTSTPINYEDINLMMKGLDKDSVYDVLGVPHYNTGILPAKKWEYRFTIVTPENAVKDCQTLVEFEKGLVSSMKVNSKECLDAIAYQPKPNERIIERVIGSANLPVRAEVQFAFDKYLEKDVTNSVDWKALAEQILKDDAKVVRLIGFTDQKGKYLYNLELASKRSDTVFSNLVKHGVDPKIIEINNLGKSKAFNERKVQIVW